MVVQVTQDARRIFRRYVKRSVLEDVVEMRTVEATLAELEQVQAATMAHITDGTSNTFALGERAWQLSGRPLQAAVALMTNGDSDAHSEQGSVYALGCGRYRLNCTDSDACARGFSSRHPGGSQFALVDGSVRFVNEHIDHNTSDSTIDSTYERLISINDGQSVGEY